MALNDRPDMQGRALPEPSRPPPNTPAARRCIPAAGEPCQLICPRCEPGRRRPQSSASRAHEDRPRDREQPAGSQSSDMTWRNARRRQGDVILPAMNFHTIQQTSRARKRLGSVGPRIVVRGHLQTCCLAGIDAPRDHRGLSLGILDAPRGVVLACLDHGCPRRYNLLLLQATRQAVRRPSRSS